MSETALSQTARADSARVGYREASRLLSLPIGTLRSMVCRRQIPHIRVSARIVVFDVSELTQWLDERRVPVANENRGPLPRL